MPRAIAGLDPGVRLSDYVSVGVIAKSFPVSRVDSILRQTDRASQRQRDLPGSLVVYYVIALALYMQVSYREVCSRGFNGCWGLRLRFGSQANRVSRRRVLGWAASR